MTRRLNDADGGPVSDDKILTLLYRAAEAGCRFAGKEQLDAYAWKDRCDGCENRDSCRARSVVSLLDILTTGAAAGGVKADTREKEALPSPGLANLQAKLETLGQLSTGIVHEINTPTQFLGDNLRFLQRAAKDVNTVIDQYAGLGEEVRSAGGHETALAAIDRTLEEMDFPWLRGEIDRTLQQSLSGVDHIAGVVHSFRAFFHPASKKKGRIDINQAIQTTIAISKNEWKYCSHIVTDLAGDVPPVTGMPDELNQVFLNLIINACHAVSAAAGRSRDVKGQILVETRRNGKWVEITFRDSGCGIPDHLGDKIFERYFTTKAEGEGSGQGLAICRDIVVDNHGGEISFESKPGKGTTFLVRLPIKHTPPPPHSNSRG